MNHLSKRNQNLVHYLSCMTDCSGRMVKHWRRFLLEGGGDGGEIETPKESRGEWEEVSPSPAD